MSNRANALSILRNQFEDLRSNPLLNAGVSIGLEGNNYFHWRFTLKGPDDTPYKSGIFCLEMKFPENFPVEKPEVIFKTPIYHLNIKHTIANHPQEEPLGHVCLSSLNWWKPNTSIRQLIQEIYALFYLANPDSGYGMDRNTLFRENKDEYERKCRKFTRKYADFGSQDYDCSNGWNFNE